MNRITGLGLRTATPISAQPAKVALPAATTLPARPATPLPAFASGQTLPAAPAQPATAEVTPERQEDIAAWVNENASAKTGFFPDSKGGTRTAEALKGGSGLGPLSNAERDLLASQAVEVWTGQSAGNRQENMREAAEDVRAHPAARKALAYALAGPELSAQEGLANGGEIVTTQDGRAADMDALSRALELDPAAAVLRFEGQEPLLAKALEHEPGLREKLWTALGDHGAIPEGQVERLATALFMFEDGTGVSSQDGRAGFAAAIADARRPGDQQTDKLGREQTTMNLKAVLEDGDARNMLFDIESPPEQRLWALDRAAGDGQCNAPDTMHGGWENEYTSRAYAAQVNDAYRGRGTDPQELSGEALRNTVGQAMGLQPDQLPEGEPSADFLARGMDNTFYSHSDQNKALDQVADQITKTGGENARVSIVPVTVTSNDEGPAVVPVFRVETDNGPKFVDHTGRSYADLEDWEKNNTLPKGKMTYAKGLDLGTDELTHANTPGVVDSFAEGFGQVVDGVAIAAGVVAGVAIIAGSGGTAAPLVAAGAGLWMAGRAGESLIDMQQHGQNIGDMTDPTVRSAWLEVAAGTLSVGAIGGAMRLASAGGKVAPGLARAVTGMSMAGEAADTLAMTDQAMQLGQNWNELSGSERAEALLGIAFWGGMAGASHMAGRGGLPGQRGDFASLDLRIRSGSTGPSSKNFPVEKSVEGLAPGEMRVAYDVQNGRATNIRIQSGSAQPSAAQLELHTRIASQMDKAGGLRDRLSQLLTGQEKPPIGSEAWEAGLEIDKINTEARQLAQDAKTADTTPEQQRIADRQRELDQALTRETERLDRAMTDGQGFIATPRSLQEILDSRVKAGEVSRGLPDGMAPVDIPAANAAHDVNYGSVNTFGQAQGIEAVLTKEGVMKAEGTSANSKIHPPGWPPKGVKNHPFSRGHLLARRLGGSGDIDENLVTLYQSPANSPVHSDFERVVYDAVMSGETVRYRVTPVYENGQNMPVALAISARGSDGLSFDITLYNKGKK